MPARLVGLGIGVAGLLLIGWAAYHLYRARTTILPHKGACALLRSGPFARFRNPIYLGDVMLLLGAAELTQNIWFIASAALFAVSVTFLAIVPEEHHLEQKFGEEYRAYKARTRRWIWFNRNQVINWNILIYKIPRLDREIAWFDCIFV